MTDFDTGHALGEDVLKNAVTKSVQYTETIIPGDVLKVTGVTSDHQEKVAKITAATDDARFIAIEGGAANDFKEVMHQGQTKKTFGASVTVGADFEFTAAGKVIDNAGTNPRKGYIIDDGAADDDLGNIYFDGGGH